jgi:hypothetical protein
MALEQVPHDFEFAGVLGSDAELLAGGSDGLIEAYSSLSFRRHSLTCGSAWGG